MRYLNIQFTVLLSLFLFSPGIWACNFLCDRLPEEHEVTVYEGLGQDKLLNADSIKLLVWNIYKQRNKKFWSEFDRLASDKDLLILQENSLDSEFLENKSSQFSMAHATNFFMKNSVRTGVSTFAKTDANWVESYVTSDLEPWVKSPKTIVASTYKMAGQSESLLVLNIHGINMKGDEALMRQLQAVEVLKAHRGPVIFAGDFNTKNSKRHKLTEDYLATYGLSKVEIPMSKKKVLDLVFVRGLNVQFAEEVLSKGSDHPALIVELSVE